VETVKASEDVLAEVRRLMPFDPEHLPAEVALVEACTRAFSGAAQVLCFDTAFHRDLPVAARMLAIPRKYYAAGVRRYGFHGLSYTYLMRELERVAGATAARGRVILAHLGNGASMAAVREGRCVDTTMAFTPTAGLVMGTRSGDLDPGVAAYLARSEGMSAEQFAEMASGRSGMLGVSETSSDVRDLLEREGSDPRAAEAIGLFCYQARKWIGALAAALGGLDTLIFAGGIGENSAVIRGRICEGLEFLGLRVDAARNERGEAVISREGSAATMRVIRTDEESVIAEAVCRLAKT
jgi:acetate kinase